VLPELALEGLADQSVEEVGDFLIVDEIQDIATGTYLDFLDLLVKGGLRDGRVLMFGDFERQAIYGSEGHARCFAPDRRIWRRSGCPRTVGTFLASDIR
jgi:hypothetical protein